jgi:hypothetical protein
MDELLRCVVPILGAAVKKVIGQSVAFQGGGRDCDGSGA